MSSKKEHGLKSRIGTQRRTADIVHTVRVPPHVHSSFLLFFSLEILLYISLSFLVLVLILKNITAFTHQTQKDHPPPNPLQTPSKP